MTFWDWIASLFGQSKPPAPKPKPVPPAPKPDPIPEPPSAMFDALGVVRADHRLPPFMPDAKADRFAQNWAAWMDANRTMTHGDFEARFDAAFPTRDGEENIAAGQKTAREVVNDWMDEPPPYGHRLNILNPSMVYVGCGHSGSYWSVVFTGR